MSCDAYVSIELQSRSQQKEALSLLCLLLPRPNRDTLQELLQHMSRVALHSTGIILVDGTEVLTLFVILVVITVTIGIWQ